LAGLLILAFSAVGYAQAPKLEFRASGFIDAQTFWGEGVPPYTGTAGNGAGVYGVLPSIFSRDAFAGGAGGNVVLKGVSNDGWNRVASDWEGRAHLKFDAVMGPNLSGTIYFEIDSVRYGSVFNTTAITREANNFGAWTTDRTAVEVKNVYIDVGLPYFGVPFPMTVRVGAQPFGVRPNVMVYSDGAGVTAGIKIDPLMIMPMYAKILQGLDFDADGSELFGLHANAKIGTFTVGGYGLAYRMNTYPLYVVTPGLYPNAGQVAGFTGLATQTPGSMKSHMYWLGAYADGKVGPLNVNFDFVEDYGSVDERALNDTGVRIPSVQYEGWLVRAKFDYPWEKFNFGSVLMWASGADARRSGTTGLPGTTTAGKPGNNAGVNATRVEGYVVPPGSEQGPANGESMVLYSMEAGATGGYGIADNANYAGLSRGGFGGTWFAKLYGSMKLAPWYKLSIYALYIGDTTQHGTTFGNAVKYATVPTADRILRNDSSIGWEFDLINEFQIYNNLRFFVGAGYLFAGNALDVSTATGVPGVLQNRAPPNPWAFRTRLMYTF